MLGQLPKSGLVKSFYADAEFPLLPLIATFTFA
jgi:hypothetical protein